MYEIFEQLLQKYGVTTYQVSKATGISQSTFSNWKNRRNLISPDKAKIIAEYFNVSLDYLMTGKEEPEKKETALSPRDERDIKKDVDAIMAKLESGEAGPAAYDGQPLSPESAELFRDALDVALRQIKILNKEKYNPHKNKK